MKFHYFADETWWLFFEKHGLLQFNDFWELSTQLIDDHNVGRGGISHVGYCQLADQSGVQQGFYVKKQDNYMCRYSLLPWIKQPTFYREFNRIQQCRRAGLNTVFPVYFALEDQKAILVTRALEGYQSLDKLEAKQQFPIGKERRHFLKVAAEECARMHLNRVRHNCFVSKHVFMKMDRDQNNLASFEMAFIDLEKAKFAFSRLRAMLQDLDKLNRSVHQFSVRDRLIFYWFYRQYWGVQRFNWLDRAIVRYFSKKWQRRMREKQLREAAA